MKLEARAVWRRYGDVEALRGASVRIEPGRTVALLGASGSGKSTLARALHLLEPPDLGEILVDGQGAPRSGEAWLRAVRRMGLVQQRPGLLRMRVWENVAFPLRARGVARGEAEREARSWLDRVRLGARADARPHELSGGEAQRVGLARALAPAPEALILDEATNQLDPESARVVEHLLREATSRGAALLLVTHSVAQARRVADDVVFLHEGRVIEAGERGVLDAPRSPELARFLEYA